MPFLTSVYRELVFNDMVLSDDKIKRMYFDLKWSEPGKNPISWLRNL